ncbi:MAG: radical SAM protein [Bacteroidales bacterium]|jgi:radical SAM protein with 4Fe4S-binding SPASM domain|nr:radical SAM protein [Bacteroidales bacterium]
MDFNLLFENNIYTIPAGDIWNVAKNRLYFVYSPLSGHILLVSHEELINIENICRGKCVGTEVQNNLLRLLKGQQNQYIFEIPNSSDDVYEIDILSNFKCNFNCSYCYSAAGRSSKEVDFENIEVIIDYLFFSGHPQKRPYKINFSGGGEPLLSFPLIKKTIDYIDEKAKETSYRYSYGLVTNGSLLNSDIIDYIKEKKINLVVSFEVLQELQDLERGNYHSVASNIDLLLQKDCPFGIRATITPESVPKMGLMVKELATRFPKLGAIVFDTVLSADIFRTPKQLNNYYDQYSFEYWSAKKLGKEIGVKVLCNSMEPTSILRTRTCQGKIVLTPDGAISSCARVSSPQEDLYDKFIYGEIKNRKLEIDEIKFSNIMSENNINNRKECQECYARWNCGGGCWLFSQSFSNEFEEPFCNFTRKALKKNLYEILNERHNAAKKESLWDSINAQIQAKNI